MEQIKNIHALLHTRRPRSNTAWVTYKTGITPLLSAKGTGYGSIMWTFIEAFTYFLWGRMSESVKPLPLPEYPQHPGSENYKEAKTGFFCSCLVARKQTLDPAQIFLSANLSACEHFSMRQQTNSDLLFQSSGTFSPGIGLKF